VRRLPPTILILSMKLPPPKAAPAVRERPG
jgi:hypothetical protein